MSDAVGQFGAKTSNSAAQSHIMSSNVNAVVVWTVVCTLMASFACRCGTLHDTPPAVPPPAEGGPSSPDAPNPFDPDQWPVAVRRARIDAIKTDILGKLGLEDVPDDGRLPEPASNVTAEERRRAMRLYRQSVDQLRGKSHRIPGEDKQLGRAKQFFSFSALQPGNRLILITVYSVAIISGGSM